MIASYLKCCSKSTVCFSITIVLALNTNLSYKCSIMCDLRMCECVKDGRKAGTHWSKRLFCSTIWFYYARITYQNCPMKPPTILLGLVYAASQLWGTIFSFESFLLVWIHSGTTSVPFLKVTSMSGLMIFLLITKSGIYQTSIHPVTSGLSNCSFMFVVAWWGGCQERLSSVTHKLLQMVIDSQSSDCVWQVL